MQVRSFGAAILGACLLATLAMGCGASDSENVIWTCQCTTECDGTTEMGDAVEGCGKAGDAQKAVDDASAACDTALAGCGTHSCSCACTPSDIECTPT